MEERSELAELGRVRMNVRAMANPKSKDFGDER
jgi:hypothetical protein